MRSKGGRYFLSPAALTAMVTEVNQCITYPYTSDDEHEPAVRSGTIVGITCPALNGNDVADKVRREGVPCIGYQLFQTDEWGFCSWCNKEGAPYLVVDVIRDYVGARIGVAARATATVCAEPGALHAESTGVTQAAKYVRCVWHEYRV